jgi:hypothetical protein
MSVRVWTLEYVPFVMGGNVWQPVSTDVEHHGEYNLGKGYKGHLIYAPSGRTYVAESRSGAFVGPSIQDVRQDIADCEDISLMEKQVTDAIEKSKQARRIKAKEFWRLLKQNEST